jgi:hypothetical protein
MSFVEKNAAEGDVGAASPCVVEKEAAEGDVEAASPCVVEKEAASNVHEGEAALQEEQGSLVGWEEATSAW